MAKPAFVKKDGAEAQQIKLLMLAPYPVFPVSAGGKIRIVQLARSLSELGIDVTILTPFHFTQRRALYAGEKFSLYQFKYPFILPFVFTDKPFPYEYLTSFHPGLITLLGDLLHRYDIYQFEHAQFAALLDYLPDNKTVIYDAHNVEYDYVRSACASKWAEAIAGQRILQLEKKLTRRGAHVFACSEGDQKRLIEIYDVAPEKISIAPNGIKPVGLLSGDNTEQTMMQKFPQLKRFPRRAIFSGSDVAHNRAAVRFIVQCLAPALRREYAFIIHGTCGRSFRQFSAANVFFDLSSDNFAAYAGAETVGLNPVVQGSGTNLKILHYLSHRMPVLSTPFGMRGYDDLRSFVSIEPPEGFIEVLKTAQFAPLPDYQELQEQYGWRKIANDMRRVYSRLLD